MQIKICKWQAITIIKITAKKIKKIHKRQLISCYSCNFRDLISFLVWEGKGTEEWGEKEKDARYRNPLFFISLSADVHKFLIG